ncbi:molybdopterin molybdotransferase MoeA [Kineobactrum salinum]|uniref:Molybdopterin molybdenumtransferase n=1 Tax=Kineobactrum salinum TaxID=2708301 RepID=A0A6C0U728_9GAMM|nr:gephyrin-like molybdotransferase Glp [Kineobactrum salinum]QIB66235.1 molybdopterin molybdotransferase MoeA [Kineobactrum salinum]
MSRLIPVEEALAQICQQSPPPPEIVLRPLLEVRGCVLARDVQAAIDVPGVDNSAMDGYALRAAEAGQGPVIAQRIAAGGASAPLAPATAARIFTGAAIPAGADTVVMQERCCERGGRLWIEGEVERGDNIRPRGQDIATGTRVLSRGRRLRAQDLGLLASVGCAEVPVYRPLRVAVLATGDELREPGQGPLQPGQLYNSNRFTLAGLLQSLNMEVVTGPVVGDDPAATASALQQAAAEADCVISSGGVSVGEEDHVRRQLEQLGELFLWRLALKPGKPFAFGKLGGVPFLGLPGNPASVFVTFCVLARPFLLRCQGALEEPPPQLTARADFAVEKPGIRRDYLRVTVAAEQGELVARRFANQSSGVLTSVAHSNALAVVPEGTTVAPGDRVEVMLLDLLT